MQEKKGRNVEMDKIKYLVDTKNLSMELLIASSIGVLGWALSKSGYGQARGASKEQKLPQPIVSETTLQTKELLVNERKQASKRWTDAQKPQETGVYNSNMVPFFRSYKSQNTREEFKQRRMEEQTGVLEASESDTGFWKHKSEQSPLFEPVPQSVSSGGGQGNIAAYDPRRYQSTGIQNNTLPFKQQMVGPGLDIDPNMPAADGFHSRFRALPADLGYKTNTLEGRINPGSASVAGRQVDPSYYSKGVPRFWTMDRRPLEKSRAADVTGPSVRPETNVKGLGRCHVDSSQERYGPAGTIGHHVVSRGGDRDRNDARGLGNMSLNVTGERAGIGAFVGANFDTSRFESQQREAQGSLGALTGDHRKPMKSSAFDLPPTFREMQSDNYNGGAGHYVPTGSTHVQDEWLPTIREQQHGRSNGFGPAAPVSATGATVQCTNRQLLKEAKRGQYSVNTYVTPAERTEAYRRAHVGDVYRCQPQVAVKRDLNENRVHSHGSTTIMYNNQMTPGQSTSNNMNKLEAENRFQDFNLAKRVLQTNELHVPIV